MVRGAGGRVSRHDARGRARRLASASGGPEGHGEKVFVSAGDGFVSNDGEITSAFAELKTHGNVHALAVEGEDTLLKAEILRELGECWIRKDEPEKARAHWSGALERFEELDAVLDAAEMRERLDAVRRTP